MLINRRSRIWMFAARLALAVLVGDVLGAAAVRPSPDAALAADLSVVCTVGGMVRGKAAPAGADHGSAFCVFCLPLLHGGSAACAGDVVVAAPTGAGAKLQPPSELPTAPQGLRLAFARGPPSV